MPWLQAPGAPSATTTSTSSSHPAAPPSGLRAKAPAPLASAAAQLPAELPAWLSEWRLRISLTQATAYESLVQVGCSAGLAQARLSFILIPSCVSRLLPTSPAGAAPQALSLLAARCYARCGRVRTSALIYADVSVMQLQHGDVDRASR